MSNYDAQGNLLVAIAGIGNANFVNVKNYGVAGDGVTDDTTAIAAANAAIATTGGVLFFPPGTYLTGPQTINPKVNYVGAGKGATIIKLKNGANADLFSAQTNLINLSAAFGVGPQGTLYNFSFQDMTLDGNKANQTAGPSYPLRFYGYSYILQNLEVRYGYSGNILSDWNSGNNFASDSMEAQWINVKTHHSGGIGVQFGGPHDSQFVNLISLLETNHCLHLAPNAVGCQLTAMHAWQPNYAVNAVAFLCEAADTYCLNCQAESSDTIQCVVLGSGFNWIGGNAFGGSVTTGSGFQIGQVGGQTPYPGMILQNAGLTTGYAPTHCRINSRISGCQGANGALYLANEGGYNDFDVTCDQSAGEAVHGTSQQTTVLKLHIQGLISDGTHNKGGGYTFTAKANSGFTINDGVNDFLNVNTMFKKLELVNNTPLYLWSGTYNNMADQLNFDGIGGVMFNGIVCGGQSATAPALATGGTINTAGLQVARVAPAAAVTGIILQAGTQPGQKITVLNESAFSVTFAAAASNVADGASDVIAATSARQFVWDSVTNLWYKIA